MIEIPLFDAQGNRTGAISVDEKLFGEKVKKKLLHEVSIFYGWNKRQGTVKTKDRGEVAGSTKKPWKQKHTGRARSGTIRSPIWRHGGVVFGPRPRDYRVKINQKMRQAALDSAILGKLLDKEVYAIEGFRFEKPSTKQMAKVLSAIGMKRSCLIGVKERQRNVYLSSRNIPGVSLISFTDLNAYDVLRHKDILLTKDAVEEMVARKGGKAGATAAVAGT